MVGIDTTFGIIKQGSVQNVKGNTMLELPFIFSEPQCRVFVHHFGTPGHEPSSSCSSGLEEQFG